MLKESEPKTQKTKQQKVKQHWLLPGAMKTRSSRFERLEQVGNYIELFFEYRGTLPKKGVKERAPSWGT